MEERFCENLIKWKNNEKSQGMHCFKQEMMESRCKRLCWWLHLAGHRDSTMVWWGNKWWRTELDHSIHQHSEAILCTTSLIHSHVGFPRILSYSWLEALNICLRKRLWMGFDLFPSLQIMVLLHCLQLSRRDLNVNSAFCTLEQHKLMEPVKGHIMLELGNYKGAGKTLDDITSTGSQSS